MASAISGRPERRLDRISQTTQGEVMANATIPISRSGRSILSFQLQGLCNALRVVVQSGQPAGSTSVALLVKLRSDMLTLVSGPCVEDLPQISGDTKSGDMLVYAELLNETLNAFLNPEEGEEKRRFFGFNQVEFGVGPLSVGLGRQQRA
jgi:hypothetical protein